MDSRKARRVVLWMSVFSLLASAPARATGAGAGTEKKPLDPARLGMTEDGLMKAFGAALKPQKIEPAVTMPWKLEISPPRGTGKDVKTPPVPPKATGVKTDPWEGQKAFTREMGEGDVLRAEYLLHAGKLFRIRWTLAGRFERPIMEDLVALGTKRYGEPAYDQNIIWKPGDPRANLWRTAWQREGKSLEIRMLNPTIGGAVYLTVSDQKVIGAIVAAGGMVAPEPETAGSWWARPHARPTVVKPEEKEALIEAFGPLLDRSGF